MPFSASCKQNVLVSVPDELTEQQLLKILFAIGKKDAAEVLHQAAEIDVLAPDLRRPVCALCCLFD